MEKSNVKAKEHSSYWTFTILGLVLPLIGIIIGIVYLTKKELLDRKVGEHTIVMSIIGFVLTFVLIGALGSSPSNLSTTTNTNSGSTTSNSDAETTKETTPSPAPKATTPKPTPTPSVPVEYKSALNQATTYANTMHLSKQGVYDQLVSQYGGKFTAEAAQYAIDNVKADWNANALSQAKTYQNTMNLSPAAVRDQLVSEYGAKFTAAEADYAIQHLND